MARTRSSKLEVGGDGTGILQRSAWSRSPITLDELVTRLDAAPRHNPLTLQSRDIPTETGIYVWYFKGRGFPAYVGKACGSKGLRHRIWAQHLNPNYLEWREEKFTAADSVQLGCAVLVRGRPCIDKSVFRRNIGRRERIAPGQGTVDYIRHRFEVAWVLLPREEIVILERELIASFGARYDLYNVSGNPLLRGKRGSQSRPSLIFRDGVAPRQGLPDPLPPGPTSGRGGECMAARGLGNTIDTATRRRPPG